MGQYDSTRAESYWSTRLGETDELSAVLSFGLPRRLNEAYSAWETRLVLDALSGMEGGSVLDVGCGVGRMTVPVAERVALVTALDNSAAMLERCRENVEAAGVADKVRYEKGSADGLDFPDGEFDAVLCLGVLEHLPPAVRDRALPELARVVRPGGLLVLVVNNGHSRLLGEESRYSMTEQQENGYFVGLMTLDTVRAALRDAGVGVQLSGSNLFHSLIKHAAQRMDVLRGDDSVADALIELALRLDLAYPLKGDLDTAYADQWVVVGRRALSDGA